MNFRQVALPTTEPVTVAEAQEWCRMGNVDNARFASLISAARFALEAASDKCLAQRDFILTMDAFPYYTDTITSQQAYPPSYYSLPRYSTTLWNYSQMIKIPKSPVIQVPKIEYIDTNGNKQTLLEGIDYVVDYMGEPGRIFTIPGQTWPAVLYVADAVKIYITAGYDPDPAATKDLTSFFLGGSPPELILPTPQGQQSDFQISVGIPEAARTAILMLVSQWYAVREPVVAGQVGVVPNSLDYLVATFANYDYSTNRG